MPQGWKKRSFMNTNNILLFQYLAPNHQLFSSAEEVFKFMKKSELYDLDAAVKFLSGIKKLEDGVKNNTANSKTEITKKNITNYIPFEPTKKNLNIPSQSKKNISIESIKESFSAISVEKANSKTIKHVQNKKIKDSVITVDVDADEDSSYVRIEPE